MLSNCSSYEHYYCLVHWLNCINKAFKYLGAKIKHITAIGGLGGSGTRVYADILQQAGIFIGNDLNRELDNLLFTRLFKNTAWYESASKDAINQRLGWFRAIMEGSTKVDKERVLTAIRSNVTFHS